jgi:hypothetical protein
MSNSTSVAALQRALRVAELHKKNNEFWLGGRISFLEEYRKLSAENARLVEQNRTQQTRINELLKTERVNERRLNV